MAKNVYYDRDGNKQEEIRKARGNPNRNNHTKRKNSNYGGYEAAAAKVKAPADQARKKGRLVLNRRQKITFVLAVTILTAMLTLQFVFFPEDDFLPTVTTLMLGLICGMLYFFRRTAPLEHTTSYKVLQAALAVISVAYTVFGAMGIMSYTGFFGF